MRKIVITELQPMRKFYRDRYSVVTCKQSLD
jgi:hypothetical protein